MTPDRNATSHEGPHLVRLGAPDIFVVFWGPTDTIQAIFFPVRGWYWEEPNAFELEHIHGPFRSSVLAYVDATRGRYEPSRHDCYCCGECNGIGVPCSHP